MNGNFGWKRREHFHPQFRAQMIRMFGHDAIHKAEATEGSDAKMKTCSLAVLQVPIHKQQAILVLSRRNSITFVFRGRFWI
jgi:hypothetical protein